MSRRPAASLWPNSGAIQSSGVSRRMPCSAASSIARVVLPVPGRPTVRTGTASPCATTWSGPAAWIRRARARPDGLHDVGLRVGRQDAARGSMPAASRRRASRASARAPRSWRGVLRTRSARVSMPMRRWPRSTRCWAPSRAPPRSSTLTLAARRAAAGRPSTFGSPRRSRPLSSAGRARRCRPARRPWRRRPTDAVVSAGRQQGDRHAWSASASATAAKNSPASASAIAALSRSSISSPTEPVGRGPGHARPGRGRY